MMPSTGDFTASSPTRRSRSSTSSCWRSRCRRRVCSSNSRLSFSRPARRDGVLVRQLRLVELVAGALEVPLADDLLRPGLLGARELALGGPDRHTRHVAGLLALQDLAAHVDLLALEVDAQALERRLLALELVAQARALDRGEQVALPDRVARVARVGHGTGRRRVERRADRGDHRGLCGHVAHELAARDRRDAHALARHRGVARTPRLQQRGERHEDEHEQQPARDQPDPPVVPPARGGRDLAILGGGAAHAGGSRTVGDAGDGSKRHRLGPEGYATELLQGSCQPRPKGSSSLESTTCRCRVGRSPDRARVRSRTADESADTFPRPGRNDIVPAPREETNHGYSRTPPEQQHRGPSRHAPRAHRRRAQRRRRADPVGAEPVRYQPAAVPRHRHQGARGADAGHRPALPGKRAGGGGARADGRRAGRHRGNVERAAAQVRPPVRRAAARAVQRGGRVGLRHGPVRDGPLLLPARPEGVPRHVVLPRPGAALRRAGRLRAGLRDRARGRPPRAEPRRHVGEGPRGAEEA